MKKDIIEMSKSDMKLIRRVYGKMAKTLHNDMIGSGFANTIDKVGMLINDKATNGKESGCCPQCITRGKGRQKMRKLSPEEANEYGDANQTILECPKCGNMVFDIYDQVLVEHDIENGTRTEYPKSDRDYWRSEFS